jgi:hypothetical protein
MWCTFLVFCPCLMGYCPYPAPVTRTSSALHAPVDEEAAENHERKQKHGHDSQCHIAARNKAARQLTYSLLANNIFSVIVFLDPHKHDLVYCRWHKANALLVILYLKRESGFQIIELFWKVTRALWHPAQALKNQQQCAKRSALGQGIVYTS